MNLRKTALEAMWLTYRHWEAWKNDKNPKSRSLALTAKVHGIVTYDRIMAGGK